MRVLSAIFLALTLLATRSQAVGTSAALAPAPASSRADLLSNSQFVFGPVARRFNLSGYLERSGSPLLADAPAIEGWCAYASVNPQVILAVLEAGGGQVTGGWQTALSAEQRRAAIGDMVMRLATYFYSHLYEYGERAVGRPASGPSITLPGGRTLALDASASSASYAVLGELAQATGAPSIEELASPDGATGFLATWQRLFPDSNPLDASVSITPSALPPPDLFQFPFPLGQTWGFSGAHNWYGNGATYGRPYSSMDFFTSGGSCSVPPASDWAVAAAGGSGYHPSGYSCWYRIDHAGGWSTSYYHLRNMVSSGQVTANRSLGTIACETCAGGWATGPHVHFSLLYNGAYVDLEGVKLSGWTVRTGSGNYETGGLEQDGVFLKPYASVRNAGIPGGTPTATPTHTATPSPTLTASPSPTPTPGPTLTPSAAPVARYVFPPVGGTIRSCPVALVAEANAPGGVARVRFWATYGGQRREVGTDSNGSDGWQAEWDCQDAPDGAATLSLAATDGWGRLVMEDAGSTPVTIRKDCAGGTYRTAFFANAGLDAAPASSWCKASGVSYKWGTASPGAGIPGADNFSARFRGNFWFDGGTYRFTGESDDGARLWVNRALVVDGWRDRPGGSAPFAATVRLPAGLSEIRLDYYERTGSAAVALSWTKVPGRVYLPFVVRRLR